jgi:transposase
MADQPTELAELKKAFEQLLDLPHIRVEQVEQDRDGHYRVTVTSTEEGTHCHRCGRHITQRYGQAPPIELRHLPIFGKRVYLRIRPIRYRCSYCDQQPTTTQKLSWYRPKSPHTKAFEQSMLLACINSTVEDVSRKEAIGYDAVMGILDRHLRKEVDWEEVGAVEVIGIDEIALKKGHQDFVVIVTGRQGDQNELLGVLPDRKKTTVKAFFSSIPKRIRKQIRAVCTDMYRGFLGAAKEVFGKRVRVVIDRFHVAKQYRSGLDRLRQQELKRLKKALPKAEYQTFHGVMWLLRKKPQELTEEEQGVLDQLFRHSPKLQQAYTFSNELTNIFTDTASKRHGTQRINGWIRRVQRSDLICFNNFLKTLKRFKHEIGNYFVNRYTSGFVEGLNNRIKVLKRRCYGLLNVGHLFQRLYLDLSGYARYA